VSVRVSTPDMPPPLSARLPSSLRYTASRTCDRPNCRRPGVITLNFDGIVLSFCQPHAEDKAGDPRGQIDWIAPGYDACPRCHRVLPERLLTEDHYRHDGLVCPPPTA
jgi:hypothetical protein